MRKLFFLALLSMFMALPLVGCAGMPEEYVEADQLTLDAVGPDYLHYVDADESLTPDQKQSKHDVVNTWELRVIEARKRVGK